MLGILPPGKRNDILYHKVNLTFDPLTHNCRLQTITAIYYLSRLRYIVNSQSFVDRTRIP